jgi:hypothetical protein
MSTLTVELFAPGKWNGMTFDVSDLKEMAKNFNTLKSVHFAPVKLGHNEEQEITEGLPALGEISDVWFADKGKDGKPKLMGKLTGLPDIVFRAIGKKRYNKLSIELDRSVNYKGQFMKYVLTAVALLGANIPAVNTLSDLNAYMSRESLFTDSERKLHFTKDFSFTTIQEDINMDDLEKAQARVRELEGENDTLKDSARDDKSKLETFARDEKSRKEADKKDEIKTARDKVTATFEKAVKDTVITPAQRDQFTKLLNVADDVAVLGIKTEDIDALLKESGGKMFTKSQSRDPKHTEETGADAGTELTAKAYEIMNTNSNLGFSAALNRAMKANPELAKAHMENKPHAA